MQRTFTLTYSVMLVLSEYSWGLKESKIWLHGTGVFEHLVAPRISASNAQVDEFFSALDLIQVWDWRSDYDSDDLGALVEDGSSWRFIASDGERQCRCGGVNAQPSFADHTVSTLDSGRLMLLYAALYDCFRIESHIPPAKRAQLGIWGIDTSALMMGEAQF